MKISDVSLSSEMAGLAKVLQKQLSSRFDFHQILNPSHRSLPESKIQTHSLYRLVVT